MNTFSGMEKLILAAARNSLQGEELVIWDKQIGAINKIQRLPDGTEVNFYRMKNGLPSFDQDIAFQNKTKELLFCKVQIRPILQEKIILANLWCVKGFLFSIEFNDNINAFPDPEACSDSNYVIDVEIVEDLSLNCD